LTEMLIKPHAFAAMGLLAAVILAPGQSEASDPTGFWVKPDSERNAKIEITKCGRGNAQLCSKIVWIENPNDSRGRPLHDVRNENPSMRDRPILGMPLFTGLTRSGPGTWTGKIYNPEDGNTYAATLTVVSRKQIMLKGCKAWLLCGERTWLRTSPPPKPKPDAELEPQIEASVEPDTAPTAQAAATAIPSPARSSSVVEDAPEAPTPVELVTPAQPPAEHHPRAGVGFLEVSTGKATAEKLSGDNVPSMLFMTKPIETDETAPPTRASAVDASAGDAGTEGASTGDASTEDASTEGASAAMTAAAAPSALPDVQEPSQAAAQTPEAVPLPDPKPRMKAGTKPPATKPQATAAAAPKPQSAPARPDATAEQESGQQTAEAPEPEEAEPAVEKPKLTRRQKRQLRRQQRPLLPWLR
jgi:uncharacterized protein (DUF2147 family)